MTPGSQDFIEFNCPAPDCLALIGVRAELAGRKVRCPACGGVTQVPPRAMDRPTPSAEIRIEAIRELRRVRRRSETDRGRKHHTESQTSRRISGHGHAHR